MKKKLLSIGLLLSFAAQASPVTGFLKLSGKSMTTAATEVVTPVAKTAAEQAANLGTSVDVINDIMNPEVKGGMWNSTVAVYSAARDGVTTFVTAHPTGTKVAAGVTGTVLTGYVLKKLWNRFAKNPMSLNDQLVSLRLGAPLFGKSTKTAADEVVAPKAEVKPSRLNPINWFGKSAADKAAAEQAAIAQAEAGKRIIDQMNGQQVANDAAIAAELQRQEEVRQVAVTRQAAPVVNPLDAEVARLKSAFTSAFGGANPANVNRNNFPGFSEAAYNVIGLA